MNLNKAFIHLSKIPSTELCVTDLTPENKRKAIDTAQYALSANGESDRRAVLQRCIIAALSEQYVAEWMKGFVMHGDEDLSDPWTYAFDVLSGPDYYGMRIEVKTHQSESAYITLHTGHKGLYPGRLGLNVRPFLECGIADLIIIFDTEDLGHSRWSFKPIFLSDVESLKFEGIVLKSKYEGYYLNKYSHLAKKNNLNISFFK